jgi:hypothetical protein
VIVIIDARVRPANDDCVCGAHCLSIFVIARLDRAIQ